MLTWQLFCHIKRNPQLTRGVRQVPECFQATILRLDEDTDVQKRAKAQFMSMLPTASGFIRQIAGLELGIQDSAAYDVIPISDRYLGCDQQRVALVLTAAYQARVLQNFDGLKIAHYEMLKLGMIDEARQLESYMTKHFGRFPRHNAKNSSDLRAHRIHYAQESLSRAHSQCNSQSQFQTDELYQKLVLDRPQETRGYVCKTQFRRKFQHLQHGIPGQVATDFAAK